MVAAPPETPSYLTHDEELIAELARRLGTRSVLRGEAKRIKLRDSIRAALSRDDHRAIVVADRDAQNNFLRPALLVKDDQIEQPESKAWADRLEPARAAIEAVLPAIGRLDLTHHDRLSWVGTGWFVAEDVMVTNRHVAVEVALGSPPYTFRRNAAKTPITCEFDTHHEYGNDEPRSITIRRVLWMAPDDDTSLDVAFLQVDKGRGVPPIRLRSTAARAGERIATIGYPGWDGYRNDILEMAAMFHGIYGVKRVSPGYVLAAADDHFSHDCTTLGGNSGSAVFDLASGVVVGLHYSGKYMHTNYAVPAHRIAELLVTHVTAGSTA
jgi:endonuclease G